MAMDRVPVSPPVPGISLNVIERLVAIHPENAPTAHPITPITRGQLLDTDFGPGPSSAAQITCADDKTQPQNPRTWSNWHHSSLRPPWPKQRPARPPLWKQRQGHDAISSCWIWRPRTSPAAPPPKDPVRAPFRRTGNAHPTTGRRSGPPQAHPTTGDTPPTASPHNRQRRRWRYSCNFSSSSYNKQRTNTESIDGRNAWKPVCS